jgi:tetratricopeptide (TPR) repeat protein/predicted Ser/Thr protein kinase
MEPASLSHYRILSKLGAGGMGVVYLADDSHLQRKVAIKVHSIPKEGDFHSYRRFLREAHTAARLDHPNICTIYHIGEEDGWAFIVMQYVDGETLAARLRGELPSLDEVIGIAEQIAAGLESAHSQGIVHRDIKPQNLMLTKKGQVKILDFGLAREMREEAAIASDGTTESQLTEAGQLLGTICYMSPEQALGKTVDQRSDIFSFGVVLYEMLTGRHPFVGENAIAVLDGIIHKDPPSVARYNERVPDELLRIVRKMLEKDRDLRYQSVHEVWSDLKRLREAPAGEAPEVSQQPIRRRGPLGLAAARLLDVLLGGAAQPALNYRRLFVVISAVCGLIALVFFVQYWRSRPYKPRPDAVRWYEDGLNAMRDGTYLKASKVLSEAVRLDPDFVLARARLSEAWLEMDYPERAKDELLLVRREESILSRLPRTERLQFEAIEFLVTGETPKGIQTYRSMLEAAEPAARSSIWLDLGRACERAADLKCALEAYQKSTQLDPQTAAGWLRLALIHQRAQRYDEATPAFDRAERLFQTASNLEGVTEVRYGRGMMLVGRGQLEAASNVLRDALKSSQTAANIQQQVKILLQLATVSIRTADSATVVKLAGEAVELARANGVEILAARALLTLGTGLFIKDRNEAEKYYQQAFEIAQRSKSPSVEARARLALASVYDAKGLLARSVAEAQLASEFFRRAGYKRETFQSMVLLGRYQRKLGDLDEAAKTFQSMLEASVSGGSGDEQAFLHEGLGQVYFVRERYRAAYASFTRSYEASMAGGNALSAGYSLLNQAACLWRIGDYDMARRRFSEAESLAQSKGFKDLLVSIGTERSAMAASEGGAPANQETLAACRGKTLDTVGTAGVWEYAESLFRCAEAALRANEASLAADWARKALEIYHRASCLDSEWRLLVLMGRAGESGAGGRARAAQARLESQWSPEDYRRYLARPDIRRYSNELKQMEARQQ